MPCCSSTFEGMVPRTTDCVPAHIPPTLVACQLLLEYVVPAGRRARGRHLSREGRNQSTVMFRYNIYLVDRIGISGADNIELEPFSSFQVLADPNFCFSSLEVCAGSVLK